jgi:hypothetical protein
MRNILHRSRVTSFVAVARGKRHKEKKREVLIQASYLGIFSYRNKKIQEVMSALCTLSPGDGAYSGHITVHKYLFTVLENSSSGYAFIVL